MTVTEIKRASAEDWETLLQIGKQTFEETFASVNTPQNMELYTSTRFNREKLLEELNNTNSEFYILWIDNTLAGYLKLNTGAAQTEAGQENSLEIERIYVLKKYQGKQLGQLLYNKAVSVARKKKVIYIWLGVWEKNEKAIAFYKRNSFVVFDEHIFKLGDEVQTDLMMKRNIE